jgi:hypothetical protein
MVYGRIPITTRHEVLQNPTNHWEDLCVRSQGLYSIERRIQSSYPPEKPPPSTTALIMKVFPVGILCSCRLVHDECKEALAKKSAHLKKEPRHFIVDPHSLMVTMDLDMSILWIVFSMFSRDLG